MAFSLNQRHAFVTFRKGLHCVCTFFFFFLYKACAAFFILGLQSLMCSRKVMASQSSRTSLSRNPDFCLWLFTTAFTCGAVFACIACAVCPVVLLIVFRDLYPRALHGTACLQQTQRYLNIASHNERASILRVAFVYFEFWRKT